jgi:hypothetical protein
MFVEHKEALEITEAPAKTLKLSEAIRIGASYRPQGFNGVLSQIHEGTSCALHAAYEAVTGGPAHDEGSDTSYNLTQWAYRIFGNAATNVIYKNDDEKWTREQIADWLESRGF